EHWAFVPPKRPPLPQVSQPRWTANAIDYFVLAELDKAGLAPSPEADNYQLIRRLSLDLRGLPPTLEEVEIFQQAIASDPHGAISALVDRFLADPAFGERWARPWLD